jgi:hypothetical protein
MAQNEQIWKWSLPRQVADVLEQHHSRCENLGLLLDKFSPYADYGNSQRTDWGLGPYGKQKIDWLKVSLRGHLKSRTIEYRFGKWTENRIPVI